MPEATFALRQSLDHTMSRLTDGLTHAFIELSGGLDSSIIAGCLAGRGFPMTALNLITPVPGADERVYARDVSVLSNIDTSYQELDLEAVEAIVEPETLHPLPGMEMLQAAVDRMSVTHFKPTRTDTLFTGAGGDSVLCYLSTAGSAADALLTFGPGSRFWTALHDLCSLYNITLWKGARLVLKKVFAKPHLGWKAERRFLSDEATAVQPFDHPWLTRPPGVPPGKAQHALESLSSKFFIEGMGRRYTAQVHLPLLCQPVVETCLRIPTWMWTDQGQNRAIARYAFADRLPDRVRLRRSKGNFVGYYGQVYERARDQLRPYLCEGELATAGLIDVAALNTYLNQPIAKRDREFQRVFELARMESWLRSTKRRLGTPT
nr:asparagine synthase C-terminal domain-containing protein [Asticcacaulis machinosus]